MAIPALLLTTAGTLLAACTATEKNADYSAVGSGTSSSVTANINAVGDLVAITAWCYTACTPVSVKLGNQTATQTLVSGLPGPGNPGTGQGFIFYVLSAAASGSQTLTFTATGGATQTQVSYIDFTATGGCTFSHDVDSPLGSFLQSINGTGAPGIINAPSITATPGDVLFNFTWSSEHVNDINSPWSCPNYTGSGETGDCQFVNTRNVAAYILSAPSGSVSNNTTDTHDSDMWQALLTSFSMSGAVQANGCPSSAPVTGSNCFFIAANGSDSNSGASESSPWLHAPGMANCAAICASTTIAGGKGFIFRGGDTWHFGNSGALPFAGVVNNCDFNASKSAGLCLASKHGSSGNPIYYGVDPGWFSGSSWTHPILTSDNPLTPKPGAFRDSVASCTYQVGKDNTLVSLESSSWIVLDGLELTGLCSKTLNGAGGDVYVVENGGANNTYEHLYIHGWTHIPFACSGGTGYCFNLRAFQGSQNAGDLHLQNVIDGSDSDPGGLGAVFGGAYHYSGNVFRYTAQIVVNNMHLWHDNLFEHWFAPGDGNAHGNVYEESGEVAGTNAFYNNVMRHLCTDSGTGTTCNGDPLIWPEPSVGTTDYLFNNVVYDVNPNLEYLNIGQNGNVGNQGPLTIFNNLFQVNSGGAGTIWGCSASGFAFPFTAANNHYITDASTPYSSTCSGQGKFVTELVMSNATAAADGYTTAQTFAYSPTSGSAPTVGTGTNEQSLCAALSSAGLSDATAACQSDTHYACNFSSSAHTVSCPSRVAVAQPISAAWDRGPYRMNSAVSIPEPPSNLTAVVQ